MHTGKKKKPQTKKLEQQQQQQTNQTTTRTKKTNQATAKNGIKELIILNPIRPPSPQRQCTTSTY